MPEQTHDMAHYSDQELSNAEEQAFQFRDWDSFVHYQKEIGRRVTAGTWTDPSPEEEES